MSISKRIAAVGGGPGAWFRYTHPIGYVRVRVPYKLAVTYIPVYR